MALTLSSPALLSGGALVRTTPSGPKRTSSLPHPILKLDGHAGPVNALAYSPSGNHLASASTDRSVFLWDTRSEYSNWAALTGHKNAILDLVWDPLANDTLLYTASADWTAAQFDTTTGTRVRSFRGHDGVVGQIVMPRRAPSQVLLTGSDDTYVLVWDPRTKWSQDSLETGLPVTALSASETGDMVFTASVDGVVKAYDVRSKKVLFSLEGHADTVLGLALSPDGTSLLSSSADGTVRIWDIRPFSATPGRQVAAMEGTIPGPHSYQHTVPAWSPNGQQVVCASPGDAAVVIWDAATRAIKYRLPGHKGSACAVAWHPEEPVVASGGADKSVFVGELDF
ncbi:WD40-repeat-containing domain protein [Blastocladiella britannica]|nr:WD40-repeat-containing domain protein [Blastocladiella britannica]